MHPQIASILFALLILALFLFDRKERPEKTSWTTYVPLFWMLLAASRHVTQWLHLGSPVDFTSESYVEGSLTDRIIFMILIAIGALILSHRRLSLRMLMRRNAFVVFFFCFGALSIAWSDYPLVSLKRLVKTSGNVIMALVILTEPNPGESFGVIMKRLGFLLLPLSVLFIRYFPSIGRQYHPTGVQMFVGVATQKNQLGQLCLVESVYFLWYLLVWRVRSRNHGKKRELVTIGIMALLLLWLLYLSNSATSLICLAVASCLLLISRLRFVAQRPRRILGFGLAIAVVFVILEATVGLTRVIIVDLLHREPSLTNRIPMWQGLLQMGSNPIRGVGYESFWLGDRLTSVWRDYDTVHQAHNGYLETYLNLGFIGLFLVGAMIASGFVKIRRQLESDYSMAILKTVLLVVIVIYNWTEASFFGVNNLWLLFFVSVLDMTGQRLLPVRHEADGVVQSRRSGDHVRIAETSAPIL